MKLTFLFYFIFFSNFIFKLYIIVLVLPNIKMNPPQVYYVFPIPNPPPSYLPITYLWAVPVHQPQASSIVHRTWTGNSFPTWYFTCFIAILPNLPTLSLSHRVKAMALLWSSTWHTTCHLNHSPGLLPWPSREQAFQPVPIWYSSHSTVRMSLVPQIHLCLYHCLHLLILFC